ncbi:MAG: TetR/AcrR family transcriptional regulator [Eubacteriales bacterium]|nr:TetR/AcrR family transcriptional regulator [Eubacteriales bacterium]
MKDTIMKAAVSLLASAGYGAASMRAIADQAGVAVGSLYVHYSSKKGLIDQLFKDAFASRMAHLLDLQARLPSSVDVLMAFIDEHFRQLAADESLALVLIRESQNPQLADLPGVRSFEEDLPKAFEAILEQGQRQGEIRPLDARLVSHLIFHMIRSAVYERQICCHHDPLSLRDELKTFIKQAISTR